MKIAGPIIAALIVFGALALRYGYTRGELTEVFPIYLPYPGTGLSTGGTFSLLRGGRFHLQVGAPATLPEMKLMSREQPPFKCDLGVIIKGPGDFQIHDSVQSLELGSWGGSENWYSPRSEWLLDPAEEYTITLKGGAVPAVFSQRGALVRLERLEPLGSSWGFPIAVGLGYVLLAGAVFLAVTVSLKTVA